MKIQVTVCLCFGIISLYSPALGNSEYLQNPSDIQENTKIEQFKKLNDEHNILNECFDLVVQNISAYIKKAKLDSLSIPDTQESIKIGQLLPTTIGEIALKNGILSGFSTVFRRKSIITSYSNGTISIHAPLEFKTLRLSCDYAAKLAVFGGSTGKVTGEIESLQVTLDLYVSLRPIAIKLSNLQIEYRDIPVHFSGSNPTDEVMNLLTPVVTTVFHDIIRDKIENSVHQPLKNQIDSINKLIVKYF